MGQVSLERMHQENAGTDRCSDRNDNFEHWTGSQKQVRAHTAGEGLKPADFSAAGFSNGSGCRIAPGPRQAD